MLPSGNANLAATDKRIGAFECEVGCSSAGKEATGQPFDACGNRCPVLRQANPSIEMIIK